MRELKNKDLFKLSKILKKIKIKIEVETEEMVNGKAEKVVKSQSQLGAEMILAMLENISLAEREVNDFMAGLLGITENEFAEMPISETMKHFNELKEMDGFVDFFKFASQLTK